jgi:hypothetical protein
VAWELWGAALSYGGVPGGRSPLLFQAACESNPAAALVIFVIVFILSIPLLPFPTWTGGDAVGRDGARRRR